MTRSTPRSRLLAALVPGAVFASRFNGGPLLRRTVLKASSSRLVFTIPADGEGSSFMDAPKGADVTEPEPGLFLVAHLTFDTRAESVAQAIDPKVFVACGERVNFQNAVLVCRKEWNGQNVVDAACPKCGAVRTISYNGPELTPEAIRKSANMFWACVNRAAAKVGV